MVIDIYLFVFFKQKTAYEMRISDWSSDVCSSDLDVERNAEEDVGRALVELERQFAVRDVRLEEAMARRERHRVEIARVPCGDDLAPRGGVGADLLDQFGDLIEMAAIGGRPIAPLLAVNGAEIAAFSSAAHTSELQSRMRI